MVQPKGNFLAKGVFLCLLAAFFFTGCFGPSQPRVCFDKDCFYVEVASTPEERAKGLMFRESLGADRGMLFVFEDEERHSFWMKNTKIALDMIWMDSRPEVVFIKNAAQPCLKEECLSIYPDRKAKYVLEVASGTAERIGLKVSDKAIFHLY